MYLGQSPEEEEPYTVSVQVEEPYYRVWLILAAIVVGIWALGRK